MWERTLQDLIRGLRANKGDEAKFIAQAVEEIRREIKNKDMELKAGAVLKLTYLEMLGHDMSWASFHVVEVMSSPKYHLKTVGYLAATQSFSQDTDVLMLTTNLLKKDLTSNPADVAVTLNGLTHIVSPDLARDLSHDLVALLNHSRPHIRKRAVIAVYKVLVKYPEATPFALTRLKEKLDDTDPGKYLLRRVPWTANSPLPGVVAATVNVLCELVRRNPSDYLTLAPQLFHLLTTSSNNWMLIKIIKLFGFLSPHEPRLVKKLQPPITELISTTAAISLLYECVHTCIVGGMLQSVSGHSLAELCVTKLAAFLQDPDQNLKYIALLALVKIVPTHAHLLAKYQDMIFSSVNDMDISIRMRALDLLSAMVTPDNLQSIVQQLLSHLVPDPNLGQTAAQSLIQNTSSSNGNNRVALSPNQSPAYRLTLSQRILAMCSQDTYSNVTDFQWYLSVLVDLAYVASVNVGAEIRDQLVDIVGRVRGVRRWGLELMVRLLSDETFLLGSKEDGSCVDVLWAAAWICGEYCGELAEPHKILPYLLQPSISTLPPETIEMYLQAATKVFGYWAAELFRHWDDDDLPKVRDAVESIIERMNDFTSNPDIEVQERAANGLQLFTFVRADLSSYHPKAPSKPPAHRAPLLCIRIEPVAAAAQASVPIPDGLDLDSWIGPPPKEPVAISETVDDEDRPARTKAKGKGKAKDSNGISGKKRKKVRNGDTLAPSPVPEKETAEERAERERQRALRLERQRDDPYYIMDKSQRSPEPQDVDSIPIVHIDLDLPPMPEAPAQNTRLSSLLRDPPSMACSEVFVIEKEGEMPEGAITPPPPQSQPASKPMTPIRNGTPSTLVPSFAEYVTEDEIPRIGTPEPIKVTRAKKSTGTGKKKKRARVVDSGTGSAVDNS
ncbi:hypothetical protein EWM64_g2988 [Hericium alpestre]|uniref:AP-3 complex subunit delta n=1 Tax=Hericium alpestre TaxID=135208 RepID=A0A4Z0A3W7_9AGAM|nr:hypothetical protein EWM64_g2988 [Hericium alpestre]